MKFSLFLIFISIYTLSFSQIVVVGQQYHDNDTTRTLGFSITNENPPIDQLISQLGKADAYTAGNIVWENYKFPFLVKEVKILIKDGIWEYKSNYSRFTTFKDEQEKASFKNDLKQRRFRGTQIEVLYKDKNIINTKRLENKFLAYFNQLLLE